MLVPKSTVLYAYAIELSEVPQKNKPACYNADGLFCVLKYVQYY